MSAAAWLTLPTSRIITLTLLHFVWQGFAVALLLWFLVEACRIRRIGARYACSLAALMLMALAPLTTLIILLAGHANDGSTAFSQLDFTDTPSPAAATFSAVWLEACEPYLLATWLIGVAIFGSRLLAGAVGVARLRRNCLPIPTKLQDVIEQLGQQLQIDAQSLVFLSEQVTDAMAIGLVRPLVLIPASWVTEMPLDMLEAVIAHELAHLARRDLWVNLLQRIVETVLFYHPAVWWLSRRLRIERELCADDLAVAATGKRLEYAQALEHIAGERLADIRPALAAFLRGENDMRLLQRVRNVLKQSPDERSRLWPAGLAALALPLGLWAAAAWNAPAVADDDDDVRPAIKRVREEQDEIKQLTAKLERLRKEAAERANKRYTPIVVEEAREEQKPGQYEQREERVLIAREGQPPQQVIRKRLVDANQNVIVETDTGADKKRLAESKSDHRLDELTALVKQLSRNVERLQDEVLSLRAEKQGDKASTEKPDRSYRLQRDDQGRYWLDSSQREREQELEKKIAIAKRDLEARARAIEQDAAKQAEAVKRAAGERVEAEARAAVQQKEAAKRAAAEKKEAAERMQRKLAEEKRGPDEQPQLKVRVVPVEQDRSEGQRAIPKRRDPTNSGERDGDDQSQLDRRRGDLKQAQEKLETFRKQVVEREKQLYELAKEQGEGKPQQVQKELRQKLDAENQEIAARAAKEKELAAVAKDIEASHKRAEAARKAIEGQIRKLKEEAAGDKTSAEREAIEQKLGKLKADVIEILASGAKTDVERKLLEIQLRKLKEEKERDTSATERKKEADQHGAVEQRELESRVIVNQPSVHEALPRLRDLKPGTIIDLRNNQGILGEKTSAERRLKQLQDNDKFQLDFTDNLDLEAKIRKTLVAEQALLK